MHKLDIWENTDKIVFKEKFIEKYSKLTDWEEFKRYSCAYLRKCIRVNTLKISVEDLKKRLEKEWNLEQVPWCKEGFWIEYKGEEKRWDVGNLKEHTLGYIYIQEAASMLPPLALNPKLGDLVLDMCASPGSKTTQMAQMMDNKGIIVANDLAGARLSPLGLNVQRCGVTNILVSLSKGQYLKDLEFDKILVDAPCSGTGTIRKSMKTILMWNENYAKKMQSVQKRLIMNAYNLLKKGGEIVYSTCTLEPEEDEEVIDFVLEKYKDTESPLVVEKIELKGLKVSEPVMEYKNKKYNSQVKNCVRIWPQDNDTEGFFICRLRKK